MKVIRVGFEPLDVPDGAIGLQPFAYRRSARADDRKVKPVCERGCQGIVDARESMFGWNVHHQQRHFHPPGWHAPFILYGSRGRRAALAQQFFKRVERDGCRLFPCEQRRTPRAKIAQFLLNRRIGQDAFDRSPDFDDVGRIGREIGSTNDFGNAGFRRTYDGGSAGHRLQ